MDGPHVESSSVASEHERDESEARYRALFDSIDQVMCIFEMLFDEEEQPIDYRFLEVNPAFEKETGLIDPVGKTARELVPELDDSWFEIYGRVALTGMPTRFENFAPAMDRWFDVYAFRSGAPEQHRVALLFNNITERKYREFNAELLEEISVDLASLGPEDEILHVVGQKIVDYLQLYRLAFCEVNEGLDDVQIFFEISEQGHRFGSERFDLSNYLSQAALDALLSGEPVAVADIPNDPRTAAFTPAHEIFGVGAHIHVTYLDDRRVKFLLAAHHSERYAWREDEADVLQKFCARLFQRLDQVRSARALAKLTVESERQKRLYEAIMSSTVDMQYIFDLEHRFLYANEAMLTIWGHSLEELIGKNLSEIGYDPKVAQSRERELDSVISSKAPLRGIEPLQLGEQGLRIYDYIFVPVLGDQGEVEAVAGTTRDITELKQHEQALLEADRRKNHFMALLSHELRNPLAPIKNSLYILAQAEISEAQARHAREVLERQVDQLTRLVGDLLDATRVEQNKIQLQLKDFELNELVRHTVKDYRVLFKRRDIALEFEICEQPIYICGDWNRLAQVVGNLLQNAAKFTERGGRTAWRAIPRAKKPTSA